MVDHNRQTIWEAKTSIDLDYCNLKQAKMHIEELTKIYGEDARIEWYQSPYSDSDREYLYVHVERPETDAEMERRIDVEKQMEKIRLERERLQYEELKKKFG